MKKILIIVLCLGMVAALAGCQTSENRSAEGGVLGALLGAGAGYAIGKQSGHGAEGAGIGAAAGALGGILVGSQIKKPGQTAQGTCTQQGPNPNQMTIQQVIDLSKQGVNEAVIIDRLRLTNSRFSLTAQDIDYLKQQGVSQKVIDTMRGM